MRKAPVALFAIGMLALTGVLVAAPTSTNGVLQASLVPELDIFGITNRARDLPEQSYPAH